MFNKLFILFLFLFSAFIYSQNQSPIVENVRFEQRTDGSFIVDIYYDANDSDGNTMTVTMQVSDDNGNTWDFTANNISGDITGVTNGTNKHIIWNFGTEHPNTFSDQFRIKILADDGISEGSGTPCPGIPTITYEGKTYNTVQIGTQCWLKENLDVGTMIQSTTGGQLQTDNGTIEKYCYDNNESNCNTYGGLYEWNEAMQYVITEGTQGICPSGWHIPTYEEMQALGTYVNDEAAKLLDESQTPSGYTATNETGFSALFAGPRYYYGGYFYYLGYSTYFWSSTESGSDAYYMRLFFLSSNVILYYHNKDYGFSVRCLKD